MSPSVRYGQIIIFLSKDPMAHVKHEANLLLIMFCNRDNVQQSNYKGCNINTHQ